MTLTSGNNCFRIKTRQTKIHKNLKFLYWTRKEFTSSLTIRRSTKYILIWLKNASKEPTISSQVIVTLWSSMIVTRNKSRTKWTIFRRKPLFWNPMARHKTSKKISRSSSVRGRTLKSRSWSMKLRKCLNLRTW